ncbi:MAG: hypothetical protein HY537_16505 [Deltaproteobacteria bacterium]|nr:hypothetical protein [Deltaproteobacteria bacterium]
MGHADHVGHGSHDSSGGYSRSIRVPTTNASLDQVLATLNKIGAPDNKAPDMYDQYLDLLRTMPAAADIRTSNKDLNTLADAHKKSIDDLMNKDNQPTTDLMHSVLEGAVLSKRLDELEKIFDLKGPSLGFKDRSELRNFLDTIKEGNAEKIFNQLRNSWSNDPIQDITDALKDPLYSSDRKLLEQVLGQYERISSTPAWQKEMENRQKFHDTLDKVQKGELPAGALDGWKSDMADYVLRTKVAANHGKENAKDVLEKLQQAFGFKDEKALLNGATEAKKNNVKDWPPMHQTKQGQNQSNTPPAPADSHQH